MKKFLEKHDLVKLTGIVLLVAALLSWLLTYSFYQNGELMLQPGTGNGIVKNIFDQSTVGVFDLNTYTLLVLYYFTTTFAYLFVVFGFYKFLGNLKAYQKLTDRIAHSFDGKEKLFVALNVLIYMVLSSISTDPIALIAFVPFTISVAKKLHLDKITGFVSTFGGILLGVLGSTYSLKITGAMTDSTNGLGVKYGYELLTTIVVALISYILLLYFTFKRIGKKVSSENEIKDLLTENKYDSKVLKFVNTIPLTICMIITFAVIFLGYTNWSNGFGVDTFTKMHTSLTNATIFGVTLPITLLGSVTLPGFGSWDLFTGASFMILMTFIVKLIQRVSFDTVIDSYVSGIRRSVRPAAILLIAYAVLVISVSYPVIPGIINQINLTLGKVDWLRPVAWVLNGGITSLFTPDFQYTLSLVGSLYAKYSNLSASAFALQSAFGLTSFIAPTSLMLIMGLSSLNIKYKDYFKFIWKFLLITLIVVLAVVYILLYA